MTSRLPFQIREAIVEVCGKAFWWKDPLRALLVGVGVPEEIYDRFADEGKFKIARHVLAELDAMGEEGWLVQRRVLTEFCKLRDVPDRNVADRDAALQALRWLKQLASDQKISFEEDRTSTEQRLVEARRRQAARAARAQKMEELRPAFAWMGRTWPGF